MSFSCAVVARLRWPVNALHQVPADMCVSRSVDGFDVWASALTRIDPFLLAKNGPHWEHDLDQSVAHPYRRAMDPICASLFSGQMTNIALSNSVRISCVVSLPLTPGWRAPKIRRSSLYDSTLTRERDAT